MENNQAQNFDEKYQVKSEIEHILSRSGMYIGANTFDIINYPLFVPSKNKILILPNIGYNAGLIKLIDEILSNSVDEHRRKESLFKITEINVQINIDGSIIISDNGGIDVLLHKQTQILIPELIFGYLRTSSNYDDNIEKNVVGTNGIGGKISNIFSIEFIVQAADGRNSVQIEWKNNMSEINKYVIVPSKEHGTIISFKIDLERFEIESLDLNTIRILQKRCIDAAAANPGLKITFKSDIAQGRLDSEWIFNSFEEYVKLYLDEKQVQSIITYKNKKDIIVLIPENIGFNFGFVNGAACSEGTHIKKLEKQLTTSILDYCLKHEMELFQERDILNRFSLFVNTTVINPTYDSQSKKTLTNKIDKYILNFTKEFLDNLNESDFMQSLKDYYEIKYLEIKKKELKKLNGLIKSTPTKKLIACASKDIVSNQLWLFEGNSASNGFRKHRNLFQSAYLLRGKITNTFNLNRTEIVENVELREVIAALGILFGEAQKNIKNCKFGKIIIASDADYDGSHICGLLVAFFGKHFPELIKNHRIFRALSPIIIASKKGQEKKYYYTLEEFEKEEHLLKGWDILYTKGLGGLDDEDYRQMLRQQKLIEFVYDNEDDMEAISIWFDKATELRKKLILEDNRENEE